MYFVISYPTKKLEISISCYLDPITNLPLETITQVLYITTL